MDEDFYTLLIDRTEGEAALRMRGCNPGKGCRAHMIIYKWFVGASGQTVTGRMKRLMSPAIPKTEAEVADTIEGWVDAGSTFEGIELEYRRPEPFKITALEQLRGVGQGKLHFETLKSQDMGFDELLQKCRDFAMRRRLEYNHKRGKDDMVVDDVEVENANMDMGRGRWEVDEWGSSFRRRTRCSRASPRAKGPMGVGVQPRGTPKDLGCMKRGKARARM